MRVSLVTPTADRPVAFALCERFVARQTVQADEWIVADGGQTPAPCTMGQIHIHKPSPPGAENFARNLLNGIAAASGELVVLIEDDDNYQPDHVRTLVEALARNPRALAAGDDRQNYYNVAHRRWRTFDNVGASLCQTAIRREAVPAFVAAVQTCLARKVFGVDATFWRSLPRNQWAIVRSGTCVGIKGLPGQAGLGIGHRPYGDVWHPDPALVKLREWVGEDAATYEGFGRRELARLEAMK